MGWGRAADCDPPVCAKATIIEPGDECWYCGLCQSICPVDAITIIFPKQMIQCKTDVTTLLGKVVE